jgi:hypothetical protein
MGGMTRTNLPIPCALVAALLVASQGTAQAADPVWPADGSEAALQAAVDSLPAAGTAVIVVPPGAWVYTGTVKIERSDTVLIGSGATRSRLYRTGEETAALVRANKSTGVRVASLGIDGNAASTSSSSGVGVWMQDVVDFRVDHCLFREHGASAVRANGTSRGVVDHSTFDKIYKPPIANLGYGVVVYGVGAIENVPFGSEKATFIEDSSFRDCRHAVASNNGARYVFRHNDVRANVVSHAIDAHGQEYGSVVGTEWVDVNHNVVAEPVYSANAVRIRGGKGVVWSNTFTGYTYGVNLTEGTPQATGPVHIWGNTVTGQQLSAGAGTTYELSAPSGYTGYEYPHPLVKAITAAAGADMVVMSAAGAEVYVDASGSKAGQGSLSAYRWYGRQGLLSSCARDVLQLEAGQHTLLLELERSDGKLSHDTLVVETAKPPLLSTSTWEQRWFRPVVGKGKVRMALRPSAAKMDGYAALTGRHAVADHDDTAIIVRASNTGHFDARNGAAYEAVSVIAYEAGKTYQLEIAIDVGAQTYDATIDGVPVAKAYAFRRPETAIGKLVAWSATGEVRLDSFTYEGELAQPDPACAPAQDAGTDGAAGAGGSGGAGGAGGAGGSAGAGGEAGAMQDGAIDTSELPDVTGDALLEAGAEAAPGGAFAGAAEDGGCSCATAGQRAGEGGWGWTLLAALAASRLTGCKRRKLARPRRNTR